MPKYIDAEKLIARMREISDEKWNKRAAPACWSDAYEYFIDELKEAETEDVAPVVHAHFECYGCNDYKCSACGDFFVIPLGCDPVTDCGMKYCPTCGAKMDEVKEDGDRRSDRGL